MTLLIFLVTGCDNESLSESWQVDRLRVLGVAATPAEPRPGDVVTFDALVVSPDRPLGGSAWFLCDGASSTDFGCAVDEAALTDAQSGDVDVQALIDAGLIGFLPGLTPTWMVPADYLDALDEADRLEGTFAMTYISAFPEVDEGETLTEDDVELAFKRTPVSLAPTPNHNPTLGAWTVDGLAIEPGAVVRLDPGQAYTLAMELPKEAVETYTFRNDDGESEERTEEPYLSWYAQEGSFNQTNTLWPTTEVVYFAPESPELPEQSVWAVVRDRRGGMAWSELKLAFP